MPSDEKPFSTQDRHGAAEEHRLSCTLCGMPSRIAYPSLSDRLYGSPGVWALAACTNPDCGLLSIEPQPTAEEIRRAYQTYYTHEVQRNPSFAKLLNDRLRLGYLASRHGYRGERNGLVWKLAGRIAGSIPHLGAAFDASVMWLPAKPGGRLLEIGCGAGENLAHLAKLGWQVTGLEPDPKAAAVARGRGLTVAEAALDDGLFAAESFDAIVMSHVIEHLSNPQEVAGICRTLLRQCGILVLLTPNTDSLGHRWYGEHWLHLDPPRHYHLFNKKALRRLAVGAGFADHRIFTVLRDANWTLAGSRALRDAGHYRIGKLPLAARLFGMVLLFAEWSRMFQTPDCGEEIVLIARK